MIRDDETLTTALVAVRLRGSLLARLDQWIARQDHHPPRPEAIRELLDQVLGECAAPVEGPSQTEQRDGKLATSNRLLSAGSVSAEVGGTVRGDPHDKSAEPATVHHFLVFDEAEEEYVIPPLKSTEDRIIRVGGEILPCTEEVVDRSALDSAGRYDPKRADR